MSGASTETITRDPREGSGARLAELIGALSLATDLGVGQPMESGLGTCLLATRFGEAAGLSEDEHRRVYYLSLLQHVGCTAMNHELADVVGDEIAFRAGIGALDVSEPAVALPYVLHVIQRASPGLEPALSKERAGEAGSLVAESQRSSCEAALMLGERLGIDERLLGDLAMVYERWDGGGLSTRPEGEEIPLPVRVLHVADGARNLFDGGDLDAVIEALPARAGGTYDPDLSAAFVRDAPDRLKVLSRESRWDQVMEAEPDEMTYLTGEEVDGVLRAMAEFIGLKSPYLVAHSTGVADLAAEAARRASLSEGEVLDLRRAGWVHDVGRVGISAALWGKAGSLTTSEWERVRLHAYYTDRVFARVGWRSDLFTLASMHHERTDGSGYFRGAPASIQSPGARILAAADAYHAMTEPRPHRPAFDSKEAAAQMADEIRAGRIDSDAGDVVLQASGERARRRRTHVAGLTAREIEVLRLVAQGLSTREIAGALTVSVKTADRHIQNIYSKVGISTRAGATLFAIQHDLVS